MTHYRVGTSGWSYDPWQPLFYPSGLKKDAWLPYYAKHLDTVELNTSFYHLPSEGLLEKWYQKTPEGFLFAIKAPQLITHKQRFLGSEDTLHTFLSRITLLKQKAGPILFQLSPYFLKDKARLAAFLALLPPDYRYVIEFRHPSWHDEEIYQLLKAHNIAFCIFELGYYFSPRTITADFIYIRFHGRILQYKGNYTAPLIAEWADWIKASGLDAYVYFNNTNEDIYAPQNAALMRKLLTEKMHSECA